MDIHGMYVCLISKKIEPLSVVIISGGGDFFFLLLFFFFISDS